ncbi:MAG: hypothetical protein H5T62_17310 [Anaerolineae bacterium]|nr:hypothetical protein [Anaerolineae bacterium]
MYRLTSVEYSTGEFFAYVYDAVGNRTVLTETTPAKGTRITQYECDGRLATGHLHGERRIHIGSNDPDTTYSG